MTRLFALLLFTFAFSFSSSGLAARSASIIIPDYSELSAFKSEWCAANSLGGTAAKVCYGYVRFREMKVRALEISDRGGASALYIDSDFQGVELTRLDISIVGPVGAGGAWMETGQASFRIDDRGEVIAVRATTARFGKLIAFRE